MAKRVIFIQGGGEDGYTADAGLVASLRTALGETYEIRYPQMHTNETLSDFGWLGQIGKEITGINGDVILVGHSLGASMLLKFLSENEIFQKIDGVFLVSTPFWNGDEDWVQGLRLQDNFAERLSEDVPFFFYHCHDDEEIPFAHLAHYIQKLPRAIFREIPTGGHQLNNDLTIVAGDIQSL